MRYYFIDFENVNLSGLDGIETLTENDQIFIFYSRHSDKIEFETVEKMLSAKASIKSIKVPVGGKNALDFQLASYLGYMIDKDKKGEYYIITKDNGFCVLEKFWKQKKVKVQVRENLKKSRKILKLAKNIKLKKNKDSSLLEKVKEKIKDEEMAVYIYSIIIKGATYQQLNNAIVKKTKDTKISGVIYKSVKPLVRENKNREEKIQYIDINQEKIEEIKRQLPNEKTGMMIAEILKNCKRYDQVHNEINKVLKNGKQASRIYKIIRPVLRQSRI